MESESRASLAYKGLREIPREFLIRLKELQVDELDLSHNELAYPFYSTRHFTLYFLCPCEEMNRP